MTPRRYMPALLLLFVGSGCAALIYEVVWFQLLQLVIGSSAVSLAVLLGHVHGRDVPGQLPAAPLRTSREHPLRVYAYLEIGIGVLGLLILFGMPLLSSIYIAWGGSGVGGLIFRALAASICLLPPTMLMGATLPAMSRWVETTPAGRVVARLLLRRQYRRRGHRQSARRLLPAARARHGRRHLCRGRAQPGRRGAGDARRARDAVRSTGTARSGERPGRGRRLGGLRRDRALRR